MSNSIMEPVTWFQFLLPGFMFMVTRRFLGRKSSDGIFVMSTIVYGVAIAFFTNPLLKIVSLEAVNWSNAKNLGDSLQALGANPFAAMAQGFAIPIGLGIFSSWLENKLRKMPFSHNFGLNSQPTKPLAILAAVRAQADNQAIAEVTLKDGSVLTGLLNKSSIIDDAEDGGSIFLTQMYFYKESSGRYLLDRQSTGAFISGSEVKSIRFFKVSATRSKK